MFRNHFTENQYFYQYWPTRSGVIGGNYIHTWCLSVRPYGKQSNATRLKTKKTKTLVGHFEFT